MSSEQPASSALLPLPELPKHQSTVRHMPMDGDWLGSCIQQHMYSLVLTERACVAGVTTHAMQLNAFCSNGATHTVTDKVQEVT